ncbi:hypothetical protein BV898_04591 [Hypsibius exemplaris]|uniref:Uncharacterized protein n=1 Tax=Hypsibius exemplaris TaxID=2072580 RepID=A0A1W0X241_HYPEX|nr:hypothetical protein BV898_04591 [Hypsibius exemplaris]
MEHSDSDSPDLLLAASLFQKQAFLLFAEGNNASLPLSAYLSSLWLQETPHEASAGSSRKIKLTICPYCGAPRDVGNFTVRIKSRKKCSKTVARNLSRTIRNATPRIKKLEKKDAEEMESFQQSRNRMNLFCKSCCKTSSLPGIPRREQKERIQMEATTHDVTSAKSVTPLRYTPTTPAKLPVSSVKRLNFRATTPSAVVSSTKKKRRKDPHAGLKITLTTSTKTAPPLATTLLASAKLGLLGSVRAAPSPSSTPQNALQKFLM